MGLIPLKSIHKLRFYIAEVITNYQYSVAPVSTKHSLYRYPCIHFWDCIEQPELRNTNGDRLRVIWKALPYNC